MMEWDEINRRLKNGTSVQILADLDGVTYKTMYNRIKYYERRDGKRYLPVQHGGKAKGATGPEEIRDSAEDPEEVKPVIIPEVSGELTEFKSVLNIPETIRREIHQKIIECTRKANEYQLLAEGWKSILKSIEEGKE